MHLLYHWRSDIHRHDLGAGDFFHLNQNSPRMTMIEPGQHLWAFTHTKGTRYALAADLVATHKVHNPPGSRYGRFRVYGDRSVSRYFRLKDAPDVTPLIDAIVGGAKNPVLGRNFQGLGAVRLISETDHQMLAVFARDLRLEPIVHFQPEDPFEYHFSGRSVDQTNPNMVAEGRTAYGDSSMSNPTSPPNLREYLIRRQIVRDPTHVGRLQDLYKGRCQICCWEPAQIYGRRLCEAHHIHWLSLGGQDSFDNMMLVCPNHHRAIHASDAQMDFLDLTLDFRSHREPVRINEHLSAAN